MKIIVCGGNGYLGWPTALNLACEGHQVLVIDNDLKLKLMAECDVLPIFGEITLEERLKKVNMNNLTLKNLDLQNFELVNDVFTQFNPDVVIHYAEQPSAPYSMKGFNEASLTLNNNLNTTMNIIWAINNTNKDCHLIKLGTMGEYGTPNIDIEEGWIDVEHNGRSQKFLYPRQAGSLYHTTKVLDTDLIWFYVRNMGLRVTDLMQGPVYGFMTSETEQHQVHTHFAYDDIFGTVVNRFMAQAVCGIPLTVYGKGGQTRGYLNLIDTLNCVRLACDNPAKSGELRIFNQFTETLTVNEIADRVKSAAQELGIDVRIQNIVNPRQEVENHYYNPKNTGLLDLGLQPTLMDTEVLKEMILEIQKNVDSIDVGKIMPKVAW